MVLVLLPGQYLCLTVPMSIEVLKFCLVTKYLFSQPRVYPAYAFSKLCEFISFGNGGIDYGNVKSFLVPSVLLVESATFQSVVFPFESVVFIL